ncbi:MAG TPA: aminotransferase class III-fold pyridoxal phosphate-dependent enzyme [Gammaproteobacteria bacterium]|nr:aminotransferase class III-fold pyridoxal phosphate-dependent enzyme [Gammaproteobacteria bacterium]
MPIGERTPAKANSGLLSRQVLRESNARSYPRRLPIAIKSARGCRVIDSEGQVYLDCLAGAGALPLGHNHPEVVQAICQAMTEQLPMQTLDLTTSIKERWEEIQSVMAVVNKIAAYFVGFLVALILLHFSACRHIRRDSKNR